MHRSHRGESGFTGKRWLLVLLAVAAVCAVGLSQVPTRMAVRVHAPADGAAAQQGESYRPPTGRVLPGQLRLGKPVRLPYASGPVTGDGRTVYVGNGTDFRPLGRVPLPPGMRMRSWVVVDLDAGTVLGEHAAHVWRPPASTIKLLTGVTAARALAPTTMHEVTKFEEGQRCACAGLHAGARYTVESMLEGMLLPSSLSRILCKHRSLDVGVDAVGVDQGELFKSLFPVGDDLALDEPAGGLAFA